MHARKIWKVMDMALDAKKPFVSLNDSGGARIQEGIPSLNGYSGILYRNTIASGYIPRSPRSWDRRRAAPSIRRP